jgi:hypothetical protein
MSNDIGPIPDARTSGDPTKKEGANEAESKVNGIRPDAGEPSIKSGEAVTTETDTGPKVATEAQINPNGPGEPRSTADQKKQEEAGGAEKFCPQIDYSKPYEEVEKAITKCMKTKYGETLVTDMEDAQLLLSYVTRNGLQEDRKISDETIQRLIASWRHLRTGVFDCEKEEKDFRKCYGVIAKAADPVTVVSLRDSLTTGPYRRWFVMKPEPLPIAEIACRTYRKLASLILILLLIAQIYWTISSSVRSKTDELIAELNKAPTKAYYIGREDERRFSNWKALNPVAAAAVTQPTLSPSLTPSESKADKTELTLDELTSKRAELEANYSILDKFMWPFRGLYFVPENPPSPDTGKEKGTPVALTPPPAKTIISNEPPPKADESIFVPSMFQRNSASICTVAGRLMDVTQKWLLPLLYGALGAVVFVVRTLSVQARDRLFRKEALVPLVLRVFLGMIAGLAIGWFWSSNPQTSTTGGALSVSTLSPFALAFVAGYGVELFFALLDKIVSTFTNKP